MRHQIRPFLAIGWQSIHRILSPKISVRASQNSTTALETRWVQPWQNECWEVGALEGAFTASAGAGFSMALLSFAAQSVEAGLRRATSCRATSSTSPLLTSRGRVAIPFESRSLSISVLS